MFDRSFGMSSGRVVSGLLLCSFAALVTGCSTSNFISAASNSPTSGFALSGAVHGGRQPISGATIQLWAVGSSGYGSAPTSLLTTPRTTDANGGFDISGDYNCPAAPSNSSGDVYVYLTAQGGDAGSGSSNPSSMLMAALGTCANLPSVPFINMNEVTTAAAAFALGQYFNSSVGGPSSADVFGAPNTVQGQVGLANAFNTVNNLVTLSTGAAVTSTTLTGAGGTVTATPESSKLNTIADILAACVNTTGGSGDPCSTLFSDVVTSAGTAPTDTLQAAVYMSLNPTSVNNNSNAYTANMSGLYGLVTGTPPFQPTLASQPTDWTIGIQYTGATPLVDPQNIAVDATGNVWVVNRNGTTAASLTELSPTGAPQVNVTTIGGQNISAIQPRNEAIDTNGNVWLETTTTALILEYNVTTPAASIVLVDTKSPYGIAIDGNDNVFVSRQSSTATLTFEEFLGGSLTTGAQVQYPLDGPTGTEQPEYMAIDTLGNVWATNGTSGGATSTQLVQMSAYNGATPGVCTVFPCTVASDPSLTATFTNIQSGTGSVPTLSTPYGIAAGPGGVIWTANSVGNTLTNMTSATAGTNYGSAASLKSPEYVAVDGTGKVWVSNNGTSSVSEFASDGTILSPVNTGTSPYTAVGFNHTGLTGGAGIAVDPSGNVWVAGQSSTVGSVWELVGAGSPTVTPISLALKNFKVGGRP
jgi:hypothetical protein